MTQSNNNLIKLVFVAIDIAKNKHQVLVEEPNGRIKKMKVMNRREDFNAFHKYLSSFNTSVLVGLEPTCNYHRNIAYFLSICGYEVKFIPSLALARTREALHNSWDKNDPKDAQVIMHMLKSGITQTYHDPLIHRINDIQELSKTHYIISQRKMKLQHSILNHYLPLYFPEAEKYFCTSRAKWFSKFLSQFPSPFIVTKLTEQDFIKKAWKVSGRKVSKENFLKDVYATCKISIGLPVEEGSEAIKMFRLILNEHLQLCLQREELEKSAHRFLKDNEQYRRLRTLPGVGPILALTIIAESGDFNRFSHHRKYLKFCGFDLSTQQSGIYRGRSKLSKRGNSKLRCAFWMAASVATRMRENTFRKKYERYIKSDPLNKDLKRKAITATAVKMARVAFSVAKLNNDYRPYYDETIPSGKVRSDGP